MRVIIDVPEKYLSVVQGLLAEAAEHSEDIVDAAVEKCKGADVEVNLKDALNKGELWQMNIAMATLAVMKYLE